MARTTKKFSKSQAVFFAELAHSIPRPRKHGTLFIQRYVEEEAAKKSHSGTDQDRAFEIICKWADLETKGHLPTYSETSVDLTFLNEVFGEALGYVPKTKSPQDYQLDAKWAVPGGGQVDGVLGRFPKEPTPQAVIELKGADVDLDRDKSNHRTAVDQCFDYLVALPECPWGILSNLSTFRLYHRNRTKRNYEEFTLQELRHRETFNKFYFLFHRGSLLSRVGKRETALLDLLKQTEETQRTVGDKLYDDYRLRRNELIHYLHVELKKPLDTAIKWAQRLLDRVIFIAFCEDRGLLPAKTLKRAYESVPAFHKVTNPRWQSYRGLFAHIDKGHPSVDLDIGFDGGLFRPEPELDDLELPDEPWARAFMGFGEYDFKEDINVDVLGHIFEKSITELEKLRPGGILAIESSNGGDSRMPKSAERKRFGIYYTPPAFTGLIVDRTVDELVRERLETLANKHKVDPDTGKGKGDKPSPEYWKDCLEMLQDFKICDPACGSGAFLIRAFESMRHHYEFVIEGLLDASKMNGAKGQMLEDSIPDLILTHNLHGVDVSREAVEITQLALWIRSARPNRRLTDISANIVCGNSLVSDHAIHERAMVWSKAFPEVFGRKGDQAGFDCVIGNPPWEQIMLHDREFFANTDSAIAMAVSAAERERLIDRLPKEKPELFAAYEMAQARAERMLKYVRNCGEFPLTGKGRTNLYMVFAEQARKIVAPDGLVGLLVPSGIATDENTKEFFTDLMDAKSIVSLFDFENRRKIFEDVDNRFKFCALVIGGQKRKTAQTDFVFFAHCVEDVAPSNKSKHISLTAADLALLNPNTKTCPIFRSRRDAELTKTVYKRVPILIDENRTTGGNPWGVTFKQGLFNQTADAKKFTPPEKLKAAGLKLEGNIWRKGKRVYLPLYEAKMIQAYDHRAASVMIEAQNWMRQGQAADTSPVQHANPEYAVLPRWWVDEELVRVELPDPAPAVLGYKRITSATNQRTMIAAMIPPVAAANSTCLILTGSAIESRRTLSLLANLNSFVLDFIARQKVGAVDLNFFIVEQFPVLPPDAYDDKCPWSKRETLEHWISERVLKLTCTAEDMKPLAEACGFKGSAPGGDGVHIWKDSERAQLMAELDAAYFHLYGIERDDVEYILTTFTNTDGRPRNEPDLGKNESQWVEGGTGNLILTVFDQLGK